MTDRVTLSASEALDLIATRAAIRQYRKAARRWTDGSRSLLADGWLEWGAEAQRFAAVTGTAAIMERLGTEPPKRREPGWAS